MKKKVQKLLKDLCFFSVDNFQVSSATSGHFAVRNRTMLKNWCKKQIAVHFFFQFSS